MRKIQIETHDKEMEPTPKELEYTDIQYEHLTKMLMGSRGPDNVTVSLPLSRCLRHDACGAFCVSYDLLESDSHITGFL